MNHSEHIYFTRSKMNSSQSCHNKEDPELGITKPIKVYSLKSKKVASKKLTSNKNKTSKKDKTSNEDKNVDFININSKDDVSDQHTTNTTINPTIIQTDTIQYSKKTPFSLQSLFTKINSASKDDEEETDINMSIKKKKVKRIHIKQKVKEAFLIH